MLIQVEKKTTLKINHVLKPSAPSTVCYLLDAKGEEREFVQNYS